MTNRLKVIASAMLAVLGLTIITVSLVGFPTVKAAERAPTPTVELPKPKAILTTKEIAQQAVFIVGSYDQEGRFDRLVSGGTGFLIETPEGTKLILTNRHVCEGAQGGDGSEYWYVLRQDNKVYAARRIGVSSKADLCLLLPPSEIQKTRTPFVLSPTKPLAGQPLIVYGHPYLRPLTEATGQFVNEIREPIGFIVPGFAGTDIVLMGRATNMIFPGNSGSPILDSKGQVVGIIFAYEGPGATALFVPTSEIRNFIQTLE